MELSEMVNNSQGQGDMPLSCSNIALTLDFNKPHRFLDVSHSSLAYWKVGTGPDLLLIHGFPLHSATYRKVVPFLAEHFTCHLLDLPGTGSTRAGLNARYSFSDHAQTMLEAVNILELSHYAILAHDSGGGIARFVAENNKAVFGLVLAGTEIPGHYTWLVRLVLLVGKVPNGMMILARMLKIKSYRHSIIGLGGCFNDKSLIDQDFSDWFVRPLIESDLVAEGQSRFLKSITTSQIDELEHVHRNIAAPVQLLWGENDPYFPVNAARKMLSTFSNGADFQTIENGRLFIHEEYPKQFADYATEFLLKNQGD